MAGWLTFEEAEAQVETASDKYLYAETDGDYILQDRLDNQSDNYGANSDSVYNNDMTTLNSTPAYNSNGDYIGEVYSGGNSMEAPEYTTTTNFTSQATAAVNNGLIYTTGGHIPGADIGFDTNGYTGYVDSLVLAEASKVTGDKWF
mgnify:CR=1 FL=1